MIGDYNLMMAPLYQWCERMRRKQQQETEADTSMWGQLGSCAPQQRRKPSFDYTIGIDWPLSSALPLSTPLVLHCFQLCTLIRRSLHVLQIMKHETLKTTVNSIGVN